MGENVDEPLINIMKIKNYFMSSSWSLQCIGGAQLKGNLVRTRADGAEMLHASKACLNTKKWQQ